MDVDFRDRIGTIDETGRRRWLFPKRPQGKLYRYRSWLSYLLLLILFIGPWVKIGSEPFFLFNVVDRKFILFGQVFWPHDFYLFVLVMITLVVFIILFTTVYGRIFCGWICPQTIFMEMVYRKIEYWIDGNRTTQKRLKEQPWSMNKIFKRVFKYGIFYLIALGISHTFLAYIIGADSLLKIQNDPVSEHLAGFIAILVFSGIFFFIYAWFREQVCVIVCPYGRFQGVMLDQNSLMVNYDYVRGEGKTGRSRLHPGENRWQGVQEQGKGSCIDCQQCVLVCPTGIDIRNGVQMECINCTACIDVCNNIMHKTGQPQGLIRIDSGTGIKKQVKNLFTLRSKAYTVVLVFLLSLITFLFTLRGAVEASILRTPGVMFQEQGDAVVNLYNIRVLNKSSEDSEFTFNLLRPKGVLELVGRQSISVQSGQEAQGAFFVKILKKDLEKHSFPVTIGIHQGGELIRSYETTFLGPGSVVENRTEQER